MTFNVRVLILSALIVLLVGAFYFRYFFQPIFATGEAVLSWNAGDDSTITGYKVYYGTNPRNADCPTGGYSKHVDAGKTTEHTITGLEQGKTYYFSVTSYNDAKKESCFSEEMKKTISDSAFKKFWKKIIGGGS